MDIPKGHVTGVEFSKLLNVSYGSITSALRLGFIKSATRDGKKTFINFEKGRFEYLSKAKFQSDEKREWAAKEISKPAPDIYAWRREMKAQGEYFAKDYTIADLGLISHPDTNPAPTEAKAGADDTAPIEDMIKDLAPGVPNQIISKAKRENFEARKSELELGELEGRLVTKESVVKNAADLAQVLKTQLTNIPSRVSAQLAVEANKDRIEKILDGEIQAALTELCNKMMTLIETGTPINEIE